MTHRPRSKRQRVIPDRHKTRPTFNAVLPPIAPFRQRLPIRFDKLPDGRLIMRDVALRISDLVAAPRSLLNLSKRWIGWLVDRADSVRAIRVLVGWCKAAYTPLISVSEWCAFPNVAGPHKPLPYMALTSESHMTISQKRIMVIEKHIVHEVSNGHDALMKAAAAL